MTQPAKIEIAGVSKRFASARGEEVTALAAIDLDIKQGEFLTIVGPSGCGKSTLLNVIAGFETASSGKATMDGRPIIGPAPQRGVVFQ
jgi:NitT/TauT family transport system ATP-binding protein